MGKNKAKSIGSKQKDHQDAFKEWKKWKGKYKKITTTAYQCKDPNNLCNHCNIDGHIEENCWNLHLELNPKNCKKDSKKKNLLAMK